MVFICFLLFLLYICDMFNLLILFIMKQFNLFLSRYTFTTSTRNNVLFLFAVSFITFCFLSVLIHFIIMDWNQLTIY